MTQAPVNVRLLRQFADILDYPRAPLADVVRRCEAEAGELTPEAGALVGEFAAFVEGCSLGELQEIYTGAFDLDTLSDLNATCYPYVGHHLFGESHKRSAFLVGLRKRFRAHGFSVAGELADHLVVLLRFAVHCDDPVLVEEILYEAVAPALRRMVGEDDGELSEPIRGRERYQRLLRAVLLVLEASAPEDLATARDQTRDQLGEEGGPAPSERERAVAAGRRV